MPKEPGVWNYFASTGASTHVVRDGRQLDAIRFFANAADGTVALYPRTTSTGLSTAAAIRVRSGFGFDWSPSAIVRPLVIVCSSSIDVFGEVSS